MAEKMNRRALEGREKVLEIEHSHTLARIWHCLEIIDLRGNV